MSNRSIPRTIHRESPAEPQIIPEDTIQVFHRLSLDAYRQLEKSIPPPTPTNDTSDIRAGFLLGVQHVLKALRDGFVVGT